MTSVMGARGVMAEVRQAYQRAVVVEEALRVAGNAVRERGRAWANEGQVACYARVSDAQEAVRKDLVHLEAALAEWGPKAQAEELAARLRAEALGQARAVREAVER